jgi:tetratricopeptide (TPR) repeat protein
MKDVLLERPRQLVETGRYAEAEKELKNILSADPERADALALFAICRAEQGQIEQALTTVRDAIRRQPDNDYFLYLIAFFHFKNDNLQESEKAARNAIAFNPNNADYFGLLSSIKLHQKNWDEALQYANAGLEKDGDNLQCLNVRSTALHKLDRKEDAFDTIHHALQKDPENEMTHTNLGWGLLEQGNHKKALEHFREALKLNPNYEYAKAGLVEGLKARYMFYKIFLKYAFWLSNMKAKGQWMVILGLYFGVKLLRILANADPTLSLILTPILFLYFAFAITTWIIDPLSNLFLRLNVYGRYALSDDQVESSNFVGISLAVGLLGGLAYLIQPDLAYLFVLVFGLSMMIPLASMYNPPKQSNRKILVAYTTALGLVGMIAIMLQVLTEDPGVFTIVYVVGIMVYQWVANALIVR